VGESIQSVTGFTVETGKVAEFAATLGDDDPFYRDEAAAAARGFKRRPALPAFTRTSIFPPLPPGRYRPAGLAEMNDTRLPNPVGIGETLSVTVAVANVRDNRSENMSSSNSI